MRIDIGTLTVPTNEVRVGNVYPIAGGWGRKHGHLMVLLAVTHDHSALMLVIDKDGNPRDVTKYGTHILQERCPVAYVDGIDTAVLNMRSL